MTSSAEKQDALARQERLAGRVSRLRSRRSDGNRDRWLLLTGGALMPLGCLFVLLGWVGAAGTPLVFEQIPYMISGGLLGVSLVFCGGFVYFAYWQTVLVRESRTGRENLQASFVRLELLLTGSGNVDFGPGGTGGDGHQRFVATATGSMIHRPNCSAVADRPNLRVVSPQTPGLTLCGLCTPFAVSR